ncbi:MAG: acyltransferase [Dongiaceae bacterium]
MPFRRILLPRPSRSAGLDTAARADTARIDALTAVRGLAAWWVVLYHFLDRLPLVPGGLGHRLVDAGYVAVDLFFVLSGFVIGLNYLEPLSAPRPAAVRGFLIARFARIYPLHLVMCALFLLNPIAILLFSQQAFLDSRYEVSSFLLNLVLMQNWGFTDQLAWNTPAWSISTEAVAYLLFPLGAGVVMQLRSRRAACLAATAALAGLALFFAAMGAHSLGADIPRYGLVRCVLEFGAGVLLARAHRLGGPPGQLAATLLLAGAVLLLGSFILLRIPSFATVPAASAMAVLALSNARAPASRLLACRPLVYLGAISYSTYMVHYFVREWIKFTLVDAGTHAAAATIAAYLAITLVASIVLFHAVELPGQRLVRRLAGLSAAPAGSASGIRGVPRGRTAR